MTKQEIIEEWQRKQQKQEEVLKHLPDCFNYKSWSDNFFILPNCNSFDDFLKLVAAIPEEFSDQHYYMESSGSLAVSFSCNEPYATLYINCHADIALQILRDYFNSDCEVVEEVVKEYVQPASIRKSVRCLAKKEG